MKSLVIAILSVLVIALGAVNSYGLSKSEIKISARQSSVQPSFFIPVLKVYFAESWEEEKEQTIEEMKEEMAELMAEKIKEAIDQAKEDADESRHLTTVTTLEKYGVKSKSCEEIALGTIAPDWAKFPEKVLVVKKVKKEHITAWEKEYEKDVLTISEATGVSPTKAKAMLNKLLSAGYRVSKDTVEVDAEVTLLHFNGWDDAYPSTLRWEVRLNGGPNLIRGYDSRGILIVQPIPEDEDGELRRVYVKAGYFDLKEKFKPKSPAEEFLLTEKDTLLEKIEELEKKLAKEEDKSPPFKRNIRDATMYDVLLKRVILEQYYVRSGASGVYLGDMKVAKEMTGYGYGKSQVINSEYKSVILTNSHVVSVMNRSAIYVSEDKERMWIVLPAYGFIRFTQESDTFGSFATILTIDDMPVDSYDNDCAILLCSAIPGYKKYAAKLGNSDKIEEGLEVVVTGSPMLMQKMLSVGVISNTKYSILSSAMADEWLAHGMSRRQYSWALASSLWCDSTIGSGGSSGSSIIALEGSQAGRVIGLRNMGIVSRHVIAKAHSKNALSIEYLVEKLGNGPLRLILPANKDLVFQGFSYRDAVFTADSKDLTGEDETLGGILQGGHRQDIAGLNAGVPITRIINFLTERGLDVEQFDAKRPNGKYWSR